jgi:3'-phosphoadenosine 5'-phosphosulfate sulfotransferase (PAPS reductase)/FAD synthetase
MPFGKHKIHNTPEKYDAWIQSLKGDVNDGFVTIDPVIRKKFNELPEEKKKTQMPPTFILYPFEIHEQQAKPFEQKEKETLEFIEEHLKAFKKPYVATSFGSDSIVLMHLVIRVCKKLGMEYPDMILNDTLNTFKEEQEYWKYITTEWGLIDKVQIMKPPKDEKGNRYTVWSIADKVGHLPTFRKFKKIKKDGTVMTGKEMGGSGGNTPECCDILKKKTLKATMNALAEEDRYDLQFVGTRAQESSMRKTSLMQRCRTYIFKHFVKYPIRTCTPLSFWTMDDTRNYYKIHSIRFNPAYEAHDQERLGCSSCPAHLHWVTRLAKDPTEEGFGMLKQNFRILKKTIEAGTETQTSRLQDSVDEVKRYLNKPESKKLSDKQLERLEGLVKEFDNIKI